MLKYKKLIFFISFLLIGILITYKIVYAEHRNIKEENAVVDIYAVDLYQLYNENTIKTDSLYLDKVITVSGLLSNWDNEKYSGMIDHKVYFQCTNPIKLNTEIEQKIKIKGRLIGFDEVLEEVKLDQCYIIE